MSKNYDCMLQERLRAYCAELGGQSKAAVAVGMSKSVVSEYLNSKYEKGDINSVETKLRDHFRVLDDRANQPSKTSPFRMADAYVPTSISEHVYKSIRYAQLEKGIMVINGDPGIGKTLAAAKFVHDHPTTAVFVTATPTTGTHGRFPRVLAEKVGVTDSRDKLQMLEEIKAKLLGTNKVLIIDEAQHLRFLALEEIRNWSTPKDPVTGVTGIGIVLIGNPQIHERMIGGHNQQYAQQYNRSRPQRYTARQTRREDVEMVFPALTARGMKKELEFLLKISQSDWALRGAVNVWNDAVNNQDVSYDSLMAIARGRGIGILQ
jgi:DNA transposition AAA+ family ATPase